MKPCSKCNDTGGYMYDDTHSKPCEVCCNHEGWWELTELHAGYEHGKNNLCCSKCGMLQRNLNNQEK